MEITLENINDQLPYYLTQDSKVALVKALKEFPRDINYYISLYENDCIQGDGWSGLDVIDFETGNKKPVKGIVLSNSCDIDPANNRSIPVKIIFAPIIKLDKYCLLLKRGGMSEGAVLNKLSDIKLQKITSLFFLPKGGGLEDDYIAVLDDLHSIPSTAFQKKDNRQKLFTLSQVGFYLFLFKLSVHFCRFHEGINRS